MEIDPKHILTIAADREMRANQKRPVILEMDLPTIIGIIGLIQLACRHPGGPDRLKSAAYAFVDTIGADLQEAGMHNLAALVQAGWHSEFDSNRD